MATQFFNPHFGSVSYQTRRTQAFGTTGEKELRGKRGGRSIVVPMRLAFKTLNELSGSLAGAMAMVGEHGVLSLSYPGGAVVRVDDCTLDAIQEVKEPTALAWDTGLNAPGWHAVYALVIYSLTPPSSAIGFGRA